MSATIRTPWHGVCAPHRSVAHTDFMAPPTVANQDGGSECLTLGGATLADLARAHRVNYLTAWRRLRAGLPMAEVLRPTKHELTRQRYGKGIARAEQLRGLLNRQIKRARA